MIVVSILPHPEFRPNDHQEDALHFNLRRVWNKQQKNLPFQNWEYQAGSQFLSVLEGNSELLQQPLMTILNIIMFEVKIFF